MAILIDKGTKLLVQGITGREGRLHTKLMLDNGTNIIAGVTPGREGKTIEGKPVYNSIKNAIRKHSEINASILFVPAAHASEAVYEAIDEDIELIIVITEQIPIHETVKFIEYAKRKNTKIIGPNCPGVISPGESMAGIMPSQFFKKGNIGIVSRSGTLTYEIAHSLTIENLGQSSAVGIGGDPVGGVDLIETIDLFQNDPETEAVVVIGEIGGNAEEKLAEKIKSGNSLPIAAYIAGTTAPKGKQMGHAGAIISMGAGSAEEKKKRLKDSGAMVAQIPSEIPRIVKKALGKLK